jgi:hypothetical protein
MSYDLIFFRKKDAGFDISKAFKYLDEKLHIEDNRGRTQWFFQNKETGSYFSIDYSESIEENEVTFGPDYLNTGFSFNINYLRPEFFGLEAFPYVDDFTLEFGLHIYNPQDREELLEYNRGSLFQNWKEINKKHSVEYFKKQNLSYLELKKSNYTWEYCRNRVELQNSLTDDIFVAGIFYNKFRNADEVLTLSIWPECIPVILPKTDNVFIIKKTKKFIGFKEEKGFVSFDQIIKTLEGLLKPAKFNDIECYILSIDDSIKARNRFEGIKIDSALVDKMEGLGVENIVNYRD